MKKIFFNRRKASQKFIILQSIIIFIVFLYGFSFSQTSNEIKVDLPLSLFSTEEVVDVIISNRQFKNATNFFAKFTDSDNEVSFILKCVIKDEKCTDLFHFTAPKETWSGENMLEIYVSNDSKFTNDDVLLDRIEVNILGKDTKIKSRSDKEAQTSSSDKSGGILEYSILVLSDKDIDVTDINNNKNISEILVKRDGNSIKLDYEENNSPPICNKKLSILKIKHTNKDQKIGATIEKIKSAIPDTSNTDVMGNSYSESRVVAESLYKHGDSEIFDPNKLSINSQSLGDFDESNVNIVIFDTGFNKDSEFYDRNDSSRIKLEKNFLEDTEKDEDITTFGKNTSSSDSIWTGKSHGFPIMLLAAGKTKGVAQNAKVIPLKVCNKIGECGEEKIIQGLCYLFANTKKEERLVINMSFSSDTKSSIITDLLKYAIDERKAIIVAAIGNESSDKTEKNLENELNNCIKKIKCKSRYQYPARSRLPGMIVVGSVYQNKNNKKWNRSLFSNKGDHLDVVAPGELVLEVDGINRSYSGTSYATPLVSGSVAILYSQLLKEKKNCSSEIIEKVFKEWFLSKDNFYNMDESSINELVGNGALQIPTKKYLEEKIAALRC